MADIVRTTMAEIIDEYLGPMNPEGILPARWEVTLKAGDIPELRCLTPVLDPTFSHVPLWLETGMEHEDE